MYIAPSILYPIGPKNIKLIGEFLQKTFFNMVWPETTIIAEFAIKNCAGIIDQISISIFLDPIRARFTVFLDFSRKEINPNFLWSGQSLLKRHNHPSSLSSLPIGLLHT